MENVVMALFEVESEAYQAIAELKRDMVNPSYTISQMGLVEKQGGHIRPCEGFDSGVDTADDTVIGGLIGGFVGILGGPVGVLFSGSVGALIGSVIDSGDTAQNVSLLEKVAQKLQDGQVALVALVQEGEDDYLGHRLSKFKVEILRWDAALIADEVAQAEQLEKEMHKAAKEKLRTQKKEERRQELEEKRAKIHADIEAFKEKFKKDS